VKATAELDIRTVSSDGVLDLIVTRPRELGGTNSRGTTPEHPFNSTYCATKHAALAVTDGLRIELKAQGTRVLGVYAGFIDTEMGASLSSGPKTCFGTNAPATHSPGTLR